MKNILFITTVFIFTITGFSQNPLQLNFKLDDNKNVIWQKVYETENIENVKKAITSSFFTSNLSDDNLIGQSPEVNLSSTKGVAMGAYSPYKVFIKIDLKENKYRVTVTDIVFVGMKTNIGGDGNVFGAALAQPSRLEDYAVKNKNNEFRKNGAATSLLKILNNDLDGYFTFNEQKSNDDW